ncbi:hypothetical protein EYF80_032035 [Liparis tanakae]|uniref:Uncharacterized protein n=1 Tax=Liparis tanakae TaxID=230148 RepID=A0A4Z2GVT5_9TELE|nr:hypothetical protein EYF80_032035 [Liparis tanakae]
MSMAFSMAPFLSRIVPLRPKLQERLKAFLYPDGTTAFLSCIITCLAMRAKLRFTRSAEEAAGASVEAAEEEVGGSVGESQAKLADVKEADGMAMWRGEREQQGGYWRRVKEASLWEGGQRVHPQQGVTPGC